MVGSRKILSPLQVCKRYIILDWLYYFSPFCICLVYGLIFFDFSSLQWLVNSIYQSPLNILACIGVLIGFRNVAKLVYCQHKVMNDMPSDIILPAASSERYGPAGGGKTSSAVLQAIFEASKMENDLTLLYHYIKSNYGRWHKENKSKLKDFHQLKQSIRFWQTHPEYIPFLGSNVEIHDANGRKSFYVDGDALEQKTWLPAMFILIDEAGNEAPQELYKERPAGITMFFRYIRHFGFRACLMEQKVDGIYINVRAVLGSQWLSMSQDNELLPYTLLNLSTWLKERLCRIDPDNYEDLSTEKMVKLHKRFQRLGKFIEKLDDFSVKLGFRVWRGLLIKCPSALEYVPPEEVTIYCTNTMPVKYDDREFSQLYLQLKDNPVKGDFVSKDSPAGKKILRRFFEQEEAEKLKIQKEELDRLKLENKLTKERLLSKKLSDSSDD